MTLLLESTLKVSFIVLLGLCAARLLSRRSAAVRHWVLATTVVCALGTPLLGLIVPAWGVPAALVSVDRGAARAAPASPPRASSVADSIELSAPTAVRPAPAAGVQRVLVRAWMAGAIVCALVLLVGIARLVWIATRATRITSGTWPAAAREIASEYGLNRPVRLLQGDHPSLLVTWGLVEPKVLVPVAAQHWTSDRIRVVLRHELAHVRRGDWIVQLASEALRCAFWFNPLLWIACTRLRQESEQACDDEVLAGGVAAPDYAAHLLEVARELKPRFVPLPAPAITRSTTLERRFHAMLDARLTRTPATKAFRFISGALLLGATALVAAAQSGPSTLSGSIVDSTGAPVPGAVVVLTNKATDAKFEVKTDDRGQFQFVPLPADSYQLEAKYPGFRTVQEAVALAGANVRRDVTLSLGSLEETISIRGGREMSFAGALGGAPRPMKQEKDLERTAYQRDLQACAPSSEGGRVRPPRKIKDVRPVYSELLQSAGVEGTVVLAATIGTDGMVKELYVVKPVHPELDAAAVDAVRQWQFDGTLLNCIPSEVTMKVSMDFKAK